MVVPAVFVSFLAALAHAKPIARSMQVHESRAQIPAAFEPRGPAAPDTMLDLRIALVQSDPAGLEKALMDVSTPGNALYGQHLSKEEVESYVTPSPEAVSAVTTWLAENGIQAKSASPAGDWLSFAIPASKANTLLEANFSEFTHTASGSAVVRTLSYSIPEDLKGYLDFVHPTTTFVQPLSAGPKFVTPPSLKPTTSDDVPSSCASNVTPACLQDLYGIPSTPATVKTNVLGVTGFLEEYANEADLKTFLSNFRPNMSSSTTFSLQTVDGGNNSQVVTQAGIEANLDTQYTVGIATDVPVVFISVGVNNTDGVDGFLDVMNYLLNQTAPPSVLSTSYGINEPELTSAIANKMCNAYMQLGARGTSIFFSSGDGGVAGSQSQNCTDFIPTFPSGCPYVTSVGATLGTTESAASFSSGGFSNFFPQPSYQSSAVSAYLSTLGSTNAGLFNASGRAFPDVSAQGNDVEIVWETETGLVAGTSCSTPIFASVVALLNDELAAAGRPPLGFLNPLLYANGSAALNDITTGSNPGCDTNGFAAAAGWDPVTGLGTPNYAKLKVAVGL